MSINSDLNVHPASFELFVVVSPRHHAQQHNSDVNSGMCVKGKHKNDETGMAPDSCASRRRKCSPITKNETELRYFCLPAQKKKP